MNLPKKSARTTRSVERNLKRHSKNELSSRLRSVPPTRMVSEREIVSTHTMT
jgi:hypothetical protein